VKFTISGLLDLGGAGLTGGAAAVGSRTLISPSARTLASGSKRSLELGSIEIV
jgi:hypothetical protein